MFDLALLMLCIMDWALFFKGILTFYTENDWICGLLKDYGKDGRLTQLVSGLWTIVGAVIDSVDKEFNLA